MNRKVRLILHGIELKPMDEKDMTVTTLRTHDIKCCGCEEKDHKKLDTVIITLKYEKATLMPEAFICYDCVEKIKREDDKYGPY